MIFQNLLNEEKNRLFGTNLQIEDIEKFLDMNNSEAIDHLINCVDLKRSKKDELLDGQKPAKKSILLLKKLRGAVT